MNAVTSAKPRCECRVAAMGGTPALGAGMVLPKLSQHQLHSLSSTESPAARELHAAQGRPDEAASTSPPPSVNTPNNSPPWLVRTLDLVCTVTGQCSKVDVCYQLSSSYTCTRRHLAVPLRVLTLQVELRKRQGNSRPSSPPKQ